MKLPSSFHVDNSRRAKAKRGGEFFTNGARAHSATGSVICRDRNEIDVKDAVMRVYEKLTRCLPDSEARLFARQLSEAFRIAGEDDDG